MAIFGKTETEQKTAARVSQPGAFLLSAVLKFPRISEKAGQAAKTGKYIFNVEKKANKIQVKKAVESAYKVKVAYVNMINNPGKAKTNGKFKGRAQAFKKAIVTLKRGRKDRTVI